MHDLLLAHQDALRPPDLSRYARELGLDVDRFTDDLRRHAGAARVAEDVDSADLSGVSGTPTLLRQRPPPPGRLRRRDAHAAVQLARAPSPRDSRRLTVAAPATPRAGSAAASSGSQWSVTQKTGPLLSRHPDQRPEDDAGIAHGAACLEMPGSADRSRSTRRPGPSLVGRAGENVWASAKPTVSAEVGRRHGRRRSRHRSCCRS